MRVLLDSHVALWWLSGDAALGQRCRAAVAEADEAFFSAVTPWELGIKRALGKLDMPDGLVAGDLLATPVTGAYGHSMASNYNKLTRPPVVFVGDGTARVVVRRETWDDLLRCDLD